jgi:hypothetical protein
MTYTVKNRLGRSHPKFELFRFGTIGFQPSLKNIELVQQIGICSTHLARTIGEEIMK